MRDIRFLLLGQEQSAMEHIEVDVVHLWDDRANAVASAVSYGKRFDAFDDEELEEGYGTLLEEET